MYYETGTLIVALIIQLLMALIPAKIASDKGKSFGLWYLYSFFLWLIALIHVAVLPMPVEIRYVQKTSVIHEDESTVAVMGIIKGPENAPDETATEVAHFQTRSVNTITCPVCHKIQKPDRNSCFSCGCRFVYDN